jgi:hypothetical protein
MGDEDENDGENTSKYDESGYKIPDSVGMTSYRCDYTPDWDSYLLYRGW